MNDDESTTKINLKDIANKFNISYNGGDEMVTIDKALLLTTEYPEMYSYIQSLKRKQSHSQQPSHVWSYAYDDTTIKEEEDINDDVDMYEEEEEDIPVPTHLKIPPPPYFDPSMLGPIVTPPIPLMQRLKYKKLYNKYFKTTSRAPIPTVSTTKLTRSTSSTDLSSTSKSISTTAKRSKSPPKMMKVITPTPTPTKATTSTTTSTSKSTSSTSKKYKKHRQQAKDAEARARKKENREKRDAKKSKSKSTTGGYINSYTTQQSSLPPSIQYIRSIIPLSIPIPLFM